MRKNAGGKQKGVVEQGADGKKDQKVNSGS